MVKPEPSAERSVSEIESGLCLLNRNSVVRLHLDVSDARAYPGAATEGFGIVKEGRFLVYPECGQRSFYGI